MKSSNNSTLKRAKSTNPYDFQYTWEQIEEELTDLTDNILQNLFPDSTDRNLYDFDVTRSLDGISVLVTLWIPRSESYRLSVASRFGSITRASLLTVFKQLDIKYRKQILLMVQDIEDAAPIS